MATQILKKIPSKIQNTLMWNYSYAVKIHVCTQIYNSDIVCSHSLLLVHFADSFHPRKVITTFPLGQCKGSALESITQLCVLGFSASVRNTEDLENLSLKENGDKKPYPHNLYEHLFSIQNTLFFSQNYIETLSCL